MMVCEIWRHGKDAWAIAEALHRRPGFAWLDDATMQNFSYIASDPSEIRHALQPDMGMPAAGSTFVAAEPFDPGQTPRWIGYVAYADSLEQAAVWFGRYDAVIAFDHARHQAYLVADDRLAAERLRQRLMTAPAGRSLAIPSQPRCRQLQVDPATWHLQAIEAALRHIAAGDIYQINLARRWLARIDGSPWPIWQRWRQRNPSPLGCYLGCGDHTVLANSMECFLRWQGPGSELVTRPIKGTLRRDESLTLADATQQLRSDAKEHAEHAMVIDLMRNDLSRTAVPGSVRVQRALEVEAYADLYHCVSTIGCIPRAELSWLDILRATFPPGSVTGVPKQRALSLIAQLEPHRRGIYTGCVGMLQRHGGMSFAVAIRTAVAQGNLLRYFAGGGIVAASDPQRELAETELKAEGFVHAVGGS